MARSRFRQGELHASALRSTPPSPGERSAIIRVALAGGPHELSANSLELGGNKTPDEATDEPVVAESSSSASSETTSDAESTFDAVGGSTGFADGTSVSRRGIATDDSTRVFRSPGDRSAMDRLAPLRRKENGKLGFTREGIDISPAKESVP